MILPGKTCEVGFKPADVVTPMSEDHAEHALDEALAESFPASDPVAVSIPKPSQTPLSKGCNNLFHQSIKYLGYPVTGIVNLSPPCASVPYTQR